MRRWSWLLGLLVIVVLGAVWWASRNAIRMEPLDAQRFAQMSETEQVEWLIEQSIWRVPNARIRWPSCWRGYSLGQTECHFTRPLRYQRILILTLIGDGSVWSTTYRTGSKSLRAVCG
jgi:hypothetical protein